MIDQELKKDIKKPRRTEAGGENGTSKPPTSRIFSPMRIPMQLYHRFLSDARLGSLDSLYQSFEKNLWTKTQVTR